MQRTPKGETDSPRLRNSLAALAPGRLLDGDLEHRRLHLRRRPVLRQRHPAAHLGQRQLAALLVEIAEPVKAISTIPHHLAGLTDAAELLGQLQQPNLATDDLLFARHAALLCFSPPRIRLAPTRRHMVPTAYNPMSDLV
jgi:hypothetical protein